jgi:CheY-like chemotaxis protein
VVQGRVPTILVVEDEAMVAMDLADCITDAGYLVLGPFDSLTEALRIGAGAEFDAALLDANLRGEKVDELAAALSKRDIPFAFVTGYGRETLSAPFRHVPLVAKPYTHDHLKEVLRTLLSAKSVPPRKPPDS